MSIKNPTQLVDEFKKSGEFDRLRRELLAQFKNNESIDSFTERVQEIVQQRLSDDAKLQFMPAENVHTELMQEMDRYPLVERAIADLPMLSDPSFSAGIRKRLDDLAKAKPQSSRGTRKKVNGDTTIEHVDGKHALSSDEDKSDGEDKVKDVEMASDDKTSESNSRLNHGSQKDRGQQAVS